MSTCTDIRERLPWYVQGGLTLEESRDVADHLVSCEACRADLALTIQLRTEVQTGIGEVPGLSDAHWQAVARRTQGTSLARVDVGSFLLGFSMGASIRQGRVPLRGELRLMGRGIKLFNTDKGGERK